MRNLLEHPVTPQEIADCCRKVAAEDTDVLGCGNMTPLLLSMAADVVEAAAGVLEGIEDRMKSGAHLSYVTPWDRATILVKAFKAVKDPPA